VTPANSATIAAAIKDVDFSQHAATVFGYGHMGPEFVNALLALGIPDVRICSHPSLALEKLNGQPGVTTFSQDVREFDAKPRTNEVAFIALPIPILIDAARRLVALGYRKLLIEKPISLWSADIEALEQDFSKNGVEAWCGYNRAAYPSFHELQAKAAADGGITSCTYTFTEFISKLNPARYTPDEMRRWGIANSLHVMSMAHGIIGLPESWKSYRSGGSVAWHPSGARFVGSGVSVRGIPFSYHADWGSTGRWSVEVHTSGPSYRLCPLEKLYRRTSATGDWAEIDITTVAPDIKTGFVEQVAAALDEKIRRLVPLYSLRDTLALTRFGESVFGYSERSI
jgi:predicted dehydrogenase